MSARIDSAVAVVRPMTIASLDGVLELELEVYPFPWTRGNFVDSLVAGYTAWTLNHVDGDLIGYCVAMAGVDEMHLLNITIAPTARQRGHASACSPSSCGCPGATARPGSGSRCERAMPRRAMRTAGSASRRSGAGRATTRLPKAGARTPSS